MTESRKYRLRSKLQESRYRLMETQPVFSLLLMYLRFVAVPGMKKISTDGRCIYFSADLVDKLYCYELDFLLCHVVMHIITGDLWRPSDFAGDNYHLACDIKNNANLQILGFERERHPHLGDVWRRLPGSHANLDAVSKTEIWNLLPFNLYSFPEKLRSKYHPDSDSLWDAEFPPDGILILDLPSISIEGAPPTPSGQGGKRKPDDEGNKDLHQTWQARLHLAEKTAADNAMDKTLFGMLPGHMRRQITETKSRLVDWRKLLQQYLQEVVCDYSFSPPDRRYDDSDFFLPDFNAKDFVLKDVLFMVDTSASVDLPKLSAVYGELQSAMEQFGGKLAGKLGFFDCRIYDPIPFESAADLAGILPYGGGGTDFCPIFTYISRVYREQPPACVVIFTDGVGPYPDPAQVPQVPVLWLIDNSQITPEFGTTVRFYTEGT